MQFRSATHRLFTMKTLLPAVIAAVSLVATARAADQPSRPYEAIVVGAGETLIRANAADDFYPMATVPTGAIVTVTGTKGDYARVDMTGRAFSGVHAYIKYIADTEPPVRLNATGRRARTLSTMPAFGPNLTFRNAPEDSWKRIVLLESDVSIEVVETIRRDDEVILRVTMPAGAAGWIRRDRIEPATAAQVTAWEASLNRSPAPPAVTEAPTTPPAETPADTTSTADPAADAPVIAPDESPAAVEPAITPAADRPVATPAGAPTTDPAAPGTPAVAEVESATPTPTDAASDAAPTDPAVTPPADATSPPAVDAASSPGEDPAIGAVLPRDASSLAPVAAIVSSHATLLRLERSYEALLDEPLEQAEVVELRHLYLELAADPAEMNPSVRRTASNRARQLALWSKTQRKLVELERLSARWDRSSDLAAASRRSIEVGAEYVAVGRLMSSTIFDGDGLPHLLRVQDTATGRTLAYVDPERAGDYATCLGVIVGVTGRTTYDSTLRLNLIEPRRIDILTAAR